MDRKQKNERGYVHIAEMKDWIDDIVENVFRYYKNRKIVLWGKYSATDSIRERLIERYGIEIAFYVDSDKAKVDNRLIFSTNCLAGKSKDYYIVIPLAFYQSLKDELLMGGYEKNIDYYYFADCIIQQSDNYYEDAHGNKIVGRYHGMKFVFSGFNASIVIGEEVCFQESTIYVHNNAKVIIEANSRLIKSTIFAYENIQIIIGSNCMICGLLLTMKNNSKILLGDDIKIDGQEEGWTLFEDSKIEIGCKGRFEKGVLTAGKSSHIKIGNNLDIMWTYQIVADDYTNISIGNNCIISYDVILRSNDGHSIFDLEKGKNINSTKEISGKRKIVIGDHVWIGMRSIILYNTEIGNGSIIGATSLVKGFIPQNCIAAGIPAELKRDNIAWEREYGANTVNKMWDYRNNN